MVTKTAMGIDTKDCLCHEDARKRPGNESIYRDTEPEVWCDECIPIPEKHKKRWGSFNCFNPVQAEAFDIFEKSPRASLIAASGTGTGKTVIAEMAIMRYFEMIGSGQRSAEHLESMYRDQGFDDDDVEALVLEELQDMNVSEGKVLVLQPLKALAHEKSEEWKEKFPELKIVPLTGDVDLGYGAERNARLMGYDVVVCSYEMLDSMSRKPSVYTYLNKVGLLIVDEIHELADRSRGGGLDGAITRFLKYRKNMGFNNQVVGLSATFANTVDLKSWLENFVVNLHIVHKEFSPIKANVKQSLSNYGFGGREDVMLREIYSMTRYMDGPILAMVLSKPAVKKLTRMLQQGPHGEKCARSHYGDMGVKERHQTEKDYRDGKFKYLIATPTLLAGVNMPCQGIVLDITYFNTDSFETDVLPIQKIYQARGRVGRLPYYNEGYVSYVCDGRVSELAISRLLDANTVRGTLFNSIDSIVNAEVNVTPITLEELLAWYQLTFSKVSNDISDENVSAHMHDIVNWLRECDYIYSVTDTKTTKLMSKPKGSMAARMMVAPKFIEHILDTLSLFSNSNIEEQNTKDNVFLHMWSNPLSEVQMNNNKLAALYKYNMELKADRLKGKRTGEYDWIKKIRVAINRITPFVEKYANLQQRKIWVATCNHFLSNSVSSVVSSGWVTK